MTYGEWEGPLDPVSDLAVAGQEEKIYSIDGVCVEKCPSANSEMYPGAGYNAQIDYFGAAVAAADDSPWLRTDSTNADNAQALNYINKGECIPICLDMNDEKYFAQIGTMTCDTLDQCRSPNKNAKSYLDKATDADDSTSDADLFAEFNAVTVDGTVTIGAATAWGDGDNRPWFGYSNKLNRMMLRATPGGADADRISKPLLATLVSFLTSL